MLQKLARRRRLFKARRDWRRLNRHNETVLIREAPLGQIEVGRNTYGPIDCLWLTKHEVRIRIGNYVSIGPEVKLLAGGVHDYKRISTWPFQSMVYHEPDNNAADHSLDIIIEDDVWIGYDSLILSGVRIGKGTVIGARSVVAKDVPPYSIFVGNKVIKKRFSDEIIAKIESLDYGRIDHRPGDAYQKYCQTRVDEETADALLNAFRT